MTLSVVSGDCHFLPTTTSRVTEVPLGTVSASEGVNTCFQQVAPQHQFPVPEGHQFPVPEGPHFPPHRLVPSPLRSLLQGRCCHWVTTWDPGERRLLWFGVSWAASSAALGRRGELGEPGSRTPPSLLYPVLHPAGSPGPSGVQMGGALARPGVLGRGTHVELRSFTAGGWRGRSTGRSHAAMMLTSPPAPF